MQKGLLTAAGIVGAFIAIFATAFIAGAVAAHLTGWDVIAVPVLAAWAAGGLWLLGHWRPDY